MCIWSADFRGELALNIEWKANEAQAQTESALKGVN